MPAQTRSGGVVYYGELDTAPPLRATLKDGAGNPIDLTGATVTIEVAYSRNSYYYSPTTKIVTNGPCLILDQMTNKGEVQWTPAEGDLTPPGTYLYTFRITYSDDTVQTIPPNTYQPLVIRTLVGGQFDRIGGP